MLCLLDGRGGGMGTAMAERMHRLCPHVRAVCISPNPEAADRMALACEGTAVADTAEAAELLCRADVIMGTAGILSAGSMQGQWPAGLAAAVASSPARKFILPMNRCGIYVAGVEGRTAAELMDELCAAAAEYLRKEI